MTIARPHPGWRAHPAGLANPSLASACSSMAALGGLRKPFKKLTPPQKNPTPPLPPRFQFWLAWSASCHSDPQIPSRKVGGGESRMGMNRLSERVHFRPLSLSMSPACSSLEPGEERRDHEHHLHLQSGKSGLWFHCTSFVFILSCLRNTMFGTNSLLMHAT